MMPLWKILARGTFTILMLVVFNLAPLDAQSAEPTATAVAAEPLTLLWQSEVSPEAVLAAPSDVAVDDWGNTYVSGQSPKHIIKFDSDGKYVTSWGGNGGDEGEFNLAAGIAVDAAGNVYVADFNNIRIQKFDSEGNFLLQWPTEPPAGPASVTVDADGFVYVDNFFAHKHHLQKFDSSGNLVLQWAARGKGDGEISERPEDLTLDPDGNIYVADRFSHRIQKFDSEGNFLAKFGGEASKDGSGLFYEPIGVAIDPEGNLYVMDSRFLQKLAPDGSPIAQWPVTEGGILDRARGIIALDKEGYLYTFAYGEGVSASGDKITPLVLKKLRLP